MFGKKEISPAEMQKLNKKAFKKTQDFFRRRVREVAANGESRVKYRQMDLCAGEHVKDWLRGLGFTCEDIGWGGWIEVSWPETVTETELLFDDKKGVKTYRT